MKADTMSRSHQNFKSYGRGKHSNHPNNVVHSSIQFDKFFCENSNKPTAAKSAGTIGKWGITSFTSIRSSTFSVGHSKETSRFSSLGKKRTQPAPDNGMQIKRPVLNNNVKRDCSPIVTNRKFFKSRNSIDDPNQKSYKSSNSSEGKKSGKHSRSVDENKKQKHCVYEENKPKHVSLVRSYEKPIKISTKKIPPLKISENTVTVSEDFHNLQNLPSPPKERDKPPIVLRIFKGTSQLISETAAKSGLSDDDGARENSDVNSRLKDNHTDLHSGHAVIAERTETDENVVDEVAAPEPEPAITTRTLRRRSPEKPKSPPEPVIPVKLSRRNSEKSNSLSPEPVAVKTRALRKRSPEKSKSKSPSPEPTAVKTRALRKRSPEKSKSPSPEPPAVKTRAVRKRSPEKSKSPSPEPPAIATRSLRRRPAAHAPCEPVPTPAPPPHTSPKRVTRSTKNMAPPSKIVITNLNSDHPSVYINDAASALVPPLTSPSRKEAKECRSYSNKHKHKQPSNKSESASKIDIDANLKKVEEILADIKSSPAVETSGTEDIDLKPSIDLGTHDTSLDSDRAELLQLLEDDEDDVTDNPDSVDETTSNNVDEPAEADTVESQNEEMVPVIINSDSELKIKIKMSDLRKPSIEAEPVEEVTPVSACSDSIDSGISVKSELEPSSIISVNSVGGGGGGQNAEPQESVDVVDDRLTSLTDVNSNSDSEAKLDACVGVSGASMQPTITNKKGSIFKHRSTNDGNKKRLALYKHKWADEKDAANNADEDKNSQATLSKTKVLDSFLDADIDDMPLTKFIRQPSENKFEFDEPVPITSVKCAKKNKDFYTVVRNVKKAHQIQESGEFQEFNDDVEYILDALQDNNPIGTRCLSAITLATKCTEPAFRMHVRAHGTVTKFFRALHDATKDQSLGLCTATVMFVLSQDRLNMDLDRDSLELMLNLLESDASHTKALEDCGLTDSQLTKTRDRVRQICADIQSQGHAKHLNLDNITVGHLSMETLLSLTSKRAGEWFKEELRELGGLEHIIKTVVECCKHVDDTANAWSTTSLEKIRKVDRCLRVLENVTMLNEQNNFYLLEYQNGILIDTLVRMYKVCDYEIPLYPTYTIGDKESTGAILRECLIANLKVLINITHDYQNKSQGSSVIGNRPGFIESSLHVLLQVPQYIPKEEKFDLMLLTLILLINLVEHHDSNRKAIIDAKAPADVESIFGTKAREPAVKALISMFYNYEELARNEEKKTDAILEGENTEKPQPNAPQKAHEDFIEETISQLVQKAGQNMEHTLIAAYVAMMIGYLIIDNEEYEKFVRTHLPEKNFQFMISVLQKFYSFMTLTASGGTVSNHGMKSIQMVIQKLIESDQRNGYNSQMIPHSDGSENKNTEVVPSDVVESQTVSDRIVSAS